MKAKRASAVRRSIDGDGVVTVAQPWSARERWILLIVVATFAATVGIAYTWRAHGPPKTLAAAPASNADDAPPRRAAQASPPSMLAQAMAATDMAQIRAEQAARPGDDVDDAPPRMDIPKGIGVFPAPGTKRIKEGIVVPDDFPLPPGFVRHYQTTDRGEMLKAILMFHPDYKPLDAHGQPVPLPADRVVPPEMAPPGLANERLTVPKDAYITPEEHGITGEPGGGDENAGGDESGDTPAP